MADVVVVGAAGQTGLRVLAALRDQGVPAGAIVRSEARRGAVAAAGAESVALGDMADPLSLEAAFTGAHTALIIPPVLHPHEDDLITASVTAAAAAGVERLVLHSVLHPYTPSMPHHLRKAAGEVAVRSSPLRWTIVQPAMYAQTVLLYRSACADGRAVQDRVLRVPWDVDRRFSVVDLQDVAEATARVMLQDGHEFACYELAGPEPLSMRNMAEHLTVLTGEVHRAVAISSSAFRAPQNWTAQAVTDAHAMFGEYDRHGLLGNPRTLSWLLDREPTRFADAMRRDAAPALR